MSYKDYEMLENYNELTIHEHMIEDLQEKIDALMIENDLLKERIEELERKIPTCNCEDDECCKVREDQGK